MRQRRYEHWHMDITPVALEAIAAAVEDALPGESGEVRMELLNVVNEIRARLQRVAIGEHDISEPSI